MLTERQQENLFRRLSKVPHNSTCADCGVKGAGWTSLDFGVFVCINCSGCHRSFGMQITRVRSTKLDAWSVNDSRLMDRIGNALANSYFLHRSERRFGQGSTQKFGSSSLRRHYIKKKYVDKAWARRGIKSPAEALKDSEFQMTRDELKKVYMDAEETESGDVDSREKKRTVGKPVKNSGKSLNLQNMKRSGKKRKDESANQILNRDADLLNFDFGPVPGLKPNSRFKKKPKLNGQSNQQKKKPEPVKKTEPTTSNQNLLDFDFLGPQPSQPAKNDDLLDFSNFGVSKPTAQAPKKSLKPPPKKKLSSNQVPQQNKNIFNTNPVPSNDIYNCLTMKPNPNYGRAQFQSNPTYPSMANGNGFSMNHQNGMRNGVNGLVNNELKQKTALNSGKQQIRIPDKYDVFDYCKNYPTPGFL